HQGADGRGREIAELGVEDLAAAVGRARKSSPQFKVRALSALPEASEVWAKLRLGALSHQARDVFRNENKVLPERPIGDYREYPVAAPVVTRRNGGSANAPHRLVVTALGSVYYASHDYRSIVVVDTTRTLLDGVHSAMAAAGFQPTQVRTVLKYLALTRLRANTDQVLAAIAAPPGERRYDVTTQNGIDYVVTRQPPPVVTPPIESHRDRARRIMARLTTEQLAAGEGRARQERPEFPVRELSTLPLVSDLWAKIWFGIPMHYPEDGNAYRNENKVLPYRPTGYYHEYVVPDATAVDKGPIRLVVGELGERYYSVDHYGSFSVITDATTGKVT
ncbi:MAG: ribonuclease domain-containing protein, partial [Pseudonocardiaceae bacterium]